MSRTARGKKLMDKLENLSNTLAANEKPFVFKFNATGKRPIVNRGKIIQKSDRTDPVYKVREEVLELNEKRIQSAKKSIIPLDKTSYDIPEVKPKKIINKVEWVDPYGLPDKPVKNSPSAHALGDFLTEINNSAKEIKETDTYADLKQIKPAEARRLNRIREDMTLTERERNAKMRKTVERNNTNEKKGAKVRTSSNESQTTFENEMKSQNISLEKNRPILRYKVKK